DLATTLRHTGGTVLLDSLGPWLAAHEDFVIDSGSLCAALRVRDGETVIVSDEVGLGLHPAGLAGRDFRDALGELNRAVAETADAVYLVVAGRALALHEASEIEGRRT